MPPAQQPPEPRASPQLVLGLVTTDLLNSSEPLSVEQVERALDLVQGLGVSVRQHPIPRAVSPDVFYGVDSDLPNRKGAQLRGIGTVRARAVLTAGHVLQGSVRVEVKLNASQRRQRWSHYSSQVGVVETIRKVEPDDVRDGFLSGAPGPGEMDLGGIAVYVMSLLDDIPQVDGGARLKTEARRLVWAAAVDDRLAAPSAAIDTGADGQFRVRLVTPPHLVPQVAAFCEVLALHDWLLATVRLAVARAGRSRRPVDEYDRALSYLGHLWNPPAFLPAETAHLWKPLEADAVQLTWEWNSTLTRVRDKVSLLTRKAFEENVFKELGKAD